MSVEAIARPVSTEWTFTMKCGAVYGSSGNSYEKWLASIPETVLSDSDFRFLLELLDEPEHVNTDLHEHIINILSANAPVRTARWFTYPQHRSLTAWIGR